MGHPAPDSTRLTAKFLIANAGLEFLLTPSKQSPLRISNRKWIAFSHSKWCSISNRSLRPSAAQVVLSPLVTHRSPARQPKGGPPDTGEPWPPRRLTGTPRLEFPATPTKQSPGPISNRDTLGGLQKRSSSEPFCRMAPSVADPEVDTPGLGSSHSSLACPPVRGRVTRHLRSGRYWARNSVPMGRKAAKMGISPMCIRGYL